MNQQRKRVVIIGAGFGGLFAAQQFKNEAVDVILIDRNNFHTFTPLLYQVATSGLEAGEIAYPVRGIFRNQRNLSFLMGEVVAIDPELKVVAVKAQNEVRYEAYDVLIVAAGSTTNFFNTPGAAENSFELKSLSDSVRLRHHVLKLYERAVWTQDETLRKALMTIVVVGGGPTGLETAGAMHELYTHVLKREYPGLSVVPRVILLEAADRLLLAYPPNLQQAALEQVQSLGVEVELGSAVVSVAPDHVILKDGRRIDTYTVIWSAGVKASPLGELLGVPLRRAGRVPVEVTMQVTGLQDVYVVGDMAYLEDETGKPYPALIPVAKQQAMVAARNIMLSFRGGALEGFVYKDRGTMATIGRSRAVALLFNRISLTGYLAWASWLVLHLVTLMGFRNRLNVLTNWTWNYITYDRAMRIILENTDANVEHVQSEQPAPAPNLLANERWKKLQSVIERINLSKVS